MILKKIADFMNAVYEFVSRTRTARGVLRDVESGKILSKKELSGINQFAQDVSFSLKQAAKKITDNPKFAKWFGDSKVLDEKGEPLVVYHGTQAQGDFNIFQTNKGRGFFPDGASFHKDPDAASAYAAQIGKARGRVYPVYLSIQNPASLKDFTKAQKAVGTDGAKVKEFLEAHGFDGMDSGGELWAFSPTQIKSIFNTEFDPANPDIRYQQTAERFYSQVVKTVEAKMPNKMAASDVMNWLKKQPGIKEAELEWMNIEEMLEGIESPENHKTA